ncbi:MAG: ATP-binding protein, partial [Chloroflexota bacterium]
SPEFSFVYYLFTFLAIEGACFIAFSHWRRNLSLIARHLAIGFGLLGIVRLLLLLISLTGAVDEVPVNYAIITISIGFLAWCFSPYLNGRTSTGMAILIGHTVAALLFLSVQTFSDSDSSLNYVWLVWQLGALGLVLVSLLQNLRSVQALVLVAFVWLIMGVILQLIVPPDTVYFIQLAEIIVYPLLMIGVYQTVIEALDTRNKAAQDLTDATVEQIERLTSLFETTKDVTSSLELSQVLDGAARGVVNAVKVDHCAIALPEEEEASQLRMVATYNPRRQGRGEAVTFPVNQISAIRHALERLREVEINSGYDTADLKFLFAMIGASKEAGPLVIQPLVLRNTAMGVLIVGNAYSKQPFGPTKLQLIRTMANQIAIAIDNAKEYKIQTTKSQQLAWTLRNQEQDSSRRQAAMEAELKKSREEVTIISQRLFEQDTIARKSQKQLTEHQQQVSNLNQELKAAREEIDSLKQENQQVADLTNVHKQQLDQIQESEKELQALRDVAGDIEAKTAEIERLQESLRNAQLRGRKLYQALQSSQAKLQQAAGMPSSITNPTGTTDLENLSCGLLISDRNGVINRVNEASALLFKRESDELIGKKLEDLTDDLKWRQALTRVNESDQQLAIASFMVEDRVIKASISPVNDANNKGAGGNIIVLYDATEEFKTQQAKDEFVASVSQDLRTPMTSVTGYVELLMGESVGLITDMQRKFLQRIKANVARMDLMLKDLIGVTAIDARQYEIKPVQTDMAEVIEDAVIGAKAQIEEKEIQLDLELPDSLPPIEVDPDGIRQIMANLLGNAAKSTPAGGNVTVKVSVTHGDADQSGEERWLQVTVVDSGGGIAEKDIDHVFDRFYAAEQPLIQGLGETGVGLSVVKYLVEAHGGKIWLDTDIGVGSSFHFVLMIKDFFNDPWEDLDVPPLDLNSEWPEA